MDNQRKQPNKRKYKYYEILHVRKNASQEEIRRAYRKLAFENFPDRNPNPNANDMAKLINQANEVLGNPKARAEYDASPAECPDCYTHEVIQTVEAIFRCRHCGCKFDISPTSKIANEVEGSTRYSLTKEKCPGCGKNLFWDAELALWRCQTKNCRRIYTFKDLHGEPRPGTETEETEIRDKLKEWFQKEEALKRSQERQDLIIVAAILGVLFFIFIVLYTMRDQLSGLFRK